MKTKGLQIYDPPGTCIASLGGAMANDRPVRRRSEEGFSLIEMLIVVGIVGVMAAVAFPNIAQYTRNYRIRGAEQQVAGMMQSARSKAIMTNANAGVSFVAVDADSYRFVQEDLLVDVAAGTVPAGAQFSPLADLPVGVRFVVATGAGAGPSVRFNRLGGYCNPAAGGTCAAAVAPTCLAAEGSRCNREAGSNYFAVDNSSMTGGLVITLLEESTGLRRTVRLAPGGRILPQP
jgi:prepilin-type N-terminal cleavage/methylation domain-containing protein